MQRAAEGIAIPAVAGSSNTHHTNTAVIPNRLSGCSMTSPRFRSKLSRAWLCHWLPHRCLYPCDANQLGVGDKKPYSSLPPQLHGLSRAEAKGNICPREPLGQRTSTWKWRSGGSQLTTKPLKSNYSCSRSCSHWQTGTVWSMMVSAVWKTYMFTDKGKS